MKIILYIILITFINASTGFNSPYSRTIGDINGDGDINVVDVVLLINLILENGNYNSDADLNNDQLINVLDVVLSVGVILPD